MYLVGNNRLASHQQGVLMMFKVGDNVECVYNGGVDYILTLGQHYIVSYANVNDSAYDGREMIGLKDMPGNPYSSSRFKLVKGPTVREQIKDLLETLPISPERVAVVMSIIS
jgi:hypothetical protein